MHDRQQQFIEETLRLVEQAVGSSRLAFYSVDDDDNLCEFVCRDVPDELQRRYLVEMHAKDPLHVRRLSVWPRPVAWLDEVAAAVAPDDLGAYCDFIHHYGTVETAEMVFRQNGRITAGMSLMWTACDMRPTPAHGRIMAGLQRYIAFNLPSWFRPVRSLPGERMGGAFRLTAREAEVARLVCCGRTNQDIALCLGIGLATVKTHLIHIFEKTGVETRAGLAARLTAAG